MGSTVRAVRFVFVCAVASVLTLAACSTDGGDGAIETSNTPVTSEGAPPLATTPTRTSEPAAESSSPQVQSAPTPIDPETFADGNGIAWTSPTGRIACRISVGEYGSGCQTSNAPVPDGAHCANPTFTVDQLSKGFYLKPDSVEPTCFNQGVFGSQFPKVLDYGTSVTSQGYTCTSLATAMTCSTGNGHGFELSTQVARSY